MTRTKHHAEQDPMQENSLIPAKEAKLVTYKLLERNFLQIQELKKGTSSVGPVKALILFHVDLPQVLFPYSFKFLFYFYYRLVICTLLGSENRIGNDLQGNSEHFD